MTGKAEISPEEVRRRIIATVSANGGHLASSLGAVEIALALARVFEPARDRVLWDVGHQAYAWKIVTDRADRFHTLRRFGGISGFQDPSESPCDAFVSGHAGVALAAAEGLAAARDARGGDEHVVAVIGDASLANGANLEALVNAAFATKRLIVVLNDNGTSGRRPPGEDFLARCGFRCAGPVDGHDVTALEEAFAEARDSGGLVFVRAVTQKGRGFAPAEAEPAKWHGVGPFSPEDGVPDGGEGPTWSAVFGEALLAEARRNPSLRALTAAMRDGTGLAPFAQELPERFFDVGICEGYLVSFAAGLARGGLRPVVAVYSTFLQRALDQVIHDVCLQNLPVVFAVDRAGAVGPDGRTHQGVFDIAFLRGVPGLTILQPKDAEDLRACLAEALAGDGPAAIRYPRGAAPAKVVVRADRDAPLQLWALGDQVPKANAAAEILARRGVRAGVVHARRVQPFDGALLAAQRAAGKTIVTLENGVIAGGFGESVGADFRFGWPNEFLPHGTVAELEERYGFTARDVADGLSRAAAATHARPV